MSFRITCWCLFDITQTGVVNRATPVLDIPVAEWLYKRNTQCNFDTILQAISLRSQPEVTLFPEKKHIHLGSAEFGFLMTQLEDEEYPCWSFEFDIQHPSVFDDGITELGYLYGDCDMVPMIKCGTEWDKLPAFLDTTEELRNIYFKVTNG